MWLFALLLAQATQATEVDRYTLWTREPALSPGPPAIVAVAPVFPTDLTTGPEGEAILLDVEIRPDGRVTRAQLVDGNETAARDSAMKAIRGWRFQAGGERSLRTVRVVFVYRTMPAGTPPEGLTTIFRGKYEIEVRRLQTGSGEPQNNQMQLTSAAAR
jgi:TonB family protein